MVFRGWFKTGGADDGDPDHTIEDLIVLERYAKAKERLKVRLKGNPDDLHSHLKLADVYTALRQVSNAVDEYIFAAEEYAQDGFYDKGLALLSRAQKLMPADETLRLKILAFQDLKGFEHKRTALVEGLRQGRFAHADASAWSLEVHRWWPKLATSPVIQLLPADQVARLFGAVELVVLAEGTVLAREGEGRAELFLILDGEVEAGVDDAGVGGRCVRTFAARDILGERALLERRAWPATYRVTKAGAAIKLDREGLEYALAGHPDPRRLLDTLRGQGTDGDVAVIVKKLRARS